ncbi:MAG: MBL fold metallo-hydrolase [Kordiimonadaceae bacterium]|jgi:glyoxylase-like metal-dependent hydrolase (beta-lactamase superfamily II)|nr:MBL fold metallo-hydrolase [Kordiimonadaceae bacterium]MBT6035049.1 MBL fold metallo-hydrolase [Kordiimonadaceae bacterium]MBT6330258.1 MBL fold metallo-hydrolase [Kordiimonadaceae bacterium]
MKYKLILLLAVIFTASCDQAPDVPSEENWYDVMPRASWAEYEQIDTGQDWFEVYKLTDNTYAIYEPNQWQEAISYLLLGTERAMLVDTLQGVGDLKAVTDKLTQLPIIVMNTHSHYDHVSSNYQYDTVYGLNMPYTANNAKGHTHDEIGGSMTPETIWKNLPDTFSFEFYESKAYEIDKFVADGEIIDLGGREIEVIYIPGHSPDSVILVDKQNRMMMTGDTFYPAPIYLYSDTASFQDFFMSAQIMFSNRNGIDFLLPGHNETMQSVDYLNELRAASLAIINPTTEFTQATGRRSYDFGAFSIIVKDPLDFGLRRGE